MVTHYINLQSKSYIKCLEITPNTFINCVLSPSNSVKTYKIHIWLHARPFFLHTLAFTQWLILFSIFYIYVLFPGMHPTWVSITPAVSVISMYTPKCHWCVSVISLAFHLQWILWLPHFPVTPPFDASSVLCGWQRALNILHRWDWAIRYYVPPAQWKIE